MNWKYYRPKFKYEEKFSDLSWPWAGHKNFAYDLVRNAKPKRIVELGTHRGTSFFSFCQAVKDEKLDAELFAVDIWKGDEHAGFYGEEVFEEVKDIKERYYKDLRIELIRKTFDEAVSDFEDESIDILHIDGLHTYEAVKHDFTNWFSKVKAEGIIIFHDIFVNRDDFGVYKLWEELKKKYQTIEFFHSFGLGVLLKDGKKYEDYIKNEKEMQMVYSFLSEERKNNEINNSLNIIRQKEEELKKKDGSCKYEIEEAMAHYQNLVKEEKEKNRQKDQAIQQKDQAIQQKDQAIQQKDQAIQQKDQAIQQKDQAIQQKDFEIQQKQKEISMMKASKFWKMRQKYMKLKGMLKL